MATTTTWSAIRDQQIADIEALTPATSPRYPFRRAPRDEPLRSWALANAESGVFRKLEITPGRTRSVTPNLHDPSAREVVVPTTILIAYPRLLGLYGLKDLDDLETTVWADSLQIHDAIFSPGNYLAGHYISSVEDVLPLERGPGPVWFQAFLVNVQFLASMTIDA